jgi:hypothetical protein
MESLVVDGSIQVLDEHISLARLAKSRVTLRPHNTAWASLDQSVVELLQSFLAINSSIVVNVGVSKRAAGHSITADTDGSDRTDLREELEEHGFGDGRVELTNVEGSRSLRVRSGRAGGRSSSIGVLGTNVGDISVDGGSAVCVASVQGSIIEVSGELVDSGGGRHLE